MAAEIGVTAKKLYFHADGRLAFDAAGARRRRSMRTSPTRRIPVPYRPRPISPTYPGGGWPTWLVEDQRFATDRPDVLTLRDRAADSRT